MRDRVSAEELRDFVRENRTKRKVDPNEASAIALRAATEIDMLNDALTNARSHGEADNPDEAALFLLRQARETADNALAGATARALEIEREAKVTASKSITDAEHQARTLLTEVEREAADARSQSQQQVVALVTEAEQHAATVVGESELRAAALNEEADRKKAETDVECERMLRDARAEVAELADRLADLDANYRASREAIRAEAERLNGIADRLDDLRGDDIPDNVTNLGVTPVSATATAAAPTAETTDDDDDDHDDDDDDSLIEEEPSIFSFFEARG